MLSLVKTVRRRKKADLIDEIQRELDVLHDTIMTNDESANAHPEVKFEDNYNFEKFRPGLIEAWNLEIQKLEPHQQIVESNLELEQFDEPFNALDLQTVDPIASLPHDEGEGSDIEEKLAKIREELNEFDVDMEAKMEQVRTDFNGIDDEMEAKMAKVREELAEI